MAKGAKKEKRATKAKKDKNAPKRAISAFFFYNQERRVTLKKEQPDLGNKDIISKMSAEWNNLSDAQKKPYVAKAEEDKKRYAKEKEAYEKKKSTPAKATSAKKSAKKNK